MATVQERIARGMALLDEKLPGWKERVNLARLDMSSQTYGLLEQLFDGYMKGLRALGLAFATGQQYGFDIRNDDEDDEGEEEWGQLTDAWIKALTVKEVNTPESK